MTTASVGAVTRALLDSLVKFHGVIDEEIHVIYTKREQEVWVTTPMSLQCFLTEYHVHFINHDFVKRASVKVQAKTHIQVWGNMEF